MFKGEWNTISYNNYIYKHSGKPIDEELLEELVESEDWMHTNWIKLTEHIPLSEQFIREHMFMCSFYWTKICITSNLSLDFLREFADMVSWSELIVRDKLSNDAIHELSNFIFFSKEDEDRYFRDKAKSKRSNNNVSWCIEHGVRIV